MKDIFNKENLITFGVIVLAIVTTTLFVMPLVRKFVPKATTTTATAAPAS